MDHVSEEEMFSLADGDFAPQERERIIRHVSSCEVCRREMSSVLSFNEELRCFWNEYLSKKCLDEDTLFSFLEGKLKGEQLSEAESHLSACSVCRHKVESARKSLDEIERLEGVRDVLLPSVIRRFKENLERIDIVKVLRGLEKTLLPSKLGEDFFAFLSESVQAFSYPFKTLLEAPALMPIAAGGVKLANTGREFQREVVMEKGAPFEVEMVQFGNRFTINLKALDESHSESLVKYSLTEEGQVRREGTAVISQGRAAVSLSEEELEALRPEETPLTLELQVIAKRDVISKVGAEDAVSFLERLQNALQSEDPEIVGAAIRAAQEIEALFPRDH